MSSLLSRLRRFFAPTVAPPLPPETPAPFGLTPAALSAVTGEPVGRMDLYVQAMKHRSLGRGRYLTAEDSNERLEFLGDSILGFVTADHLFARFPDQDEGFLTRLRSRLVNGKALADRATRIGLGELVLLSEHAVQDRGRANENILADAYEALIGALFLDQGIEAATRFVHRTGLDGIDLESLAEKDDNHKSLLLEYSQARGWPQPVYRLIHEEGPGHDRTFTVEAVVRGEGLATGKARSKKRAEQLAAASALEHIARAGE